MDSQKFRILHLSDIHFGRTNDHVINLIPRDAIDLLILTGDLTQRAKKSQFKAALAFLKQFSCPIFLIPGNHDVPLYNFFLRIFDPYRRFCKAMADLSADFYENDRVAVYGLWTLNPFTAQSGKLYRSQLKRATEKLSLVSSEKVKIIAAHHPLTTIDSELGKPRLQQLLNLKPDLMMWGHEHQSSVHYYRPADQSGPVMLAAGTGFSSRIREETNSYNVITIDEQHLHVEIWNYSDETSNFKLCHAESFKQNRHS